MKTTQAWGWLVAGVLAAGLNASYHNGGLQWAHQVADRFEQGSAAVVALASGRADQFLAEARLLRAQNETPSCPLATTLARVQTMVRRSGIDRSTLGHSQAGLDVMSAREQAQLDRLEASRARMEAQIEARVATQTAHFRIATANLVPIEIKGIPAPVICPRVRVHVPRLPVIKTPFAPDIHIEMAGTGPV
jgi:hypothetical protein